LPKPEITRGVLNAKLVNRCGEAAASLVKSFREAGHHDKCTTDFGDQDRKRTAVEAVRRSSLTDTSRLQLVERFREKGIYQVTGVESPKDGGGHGTRYCATFEGNSWLDELMRKTYAVALINAGATLDDIREAITTLEDIERTARRVLGGANPITTRIVASLRDARAALRAREAPSAQTGGAS
jgi:hypothetical protein